MEVNCQFNVTVSTVCYLHMCSVVRRHQSSDGAADAVVTLSSPVSMEEYAKRIPHDRKNVAIRTDVEIANIAKKLECWELIAPFLGLSTPQVKELKKDYGCYEEQKLAMKKLFMYIT